MNSKIINIIKKINTGLIERENQIKIGLLAVISGENFLLIGPPGTGKSQLTRRLAIAFKNIDYFEYLLTKFTSPEELFGPISIKELENDRFHRNTKGYLTDSHIVFLDEIFKSNSAILNSLLTIMNEKIYHNGYIREGIKTRSILGASNELPQNEYELEALYDRFLFREKIDYIKNTESLIFLNETVPSLSENEKLDIHDFEALNNNIKDIIINQKIAKKIINIKKRVFEELNETVSDRRVVKIIRILKTSAYTSNRNEVNDFDLLLLDYLIWKNAENSSSIKSIIKKEILEAETLEIGEFLYILNKWLVHFNSFFYEPQQSSDGVNLFYDRHFNLTTDTRGTINVKDALGNFVFYKGYRDHIKILNELGKFDHGYIDSGLRTIDKKTIWIYEFSSTEVISDFNSEFDGFKNLTIEGGLEPAMITTFAEYYAIYKKSKPDFKNIFEEIRKNVKYELDKVEIIYEELIKKKEILDLQVDECIWIPFEEILDVKDTIEIRIKETFTLIGNFKELIIDLDRALL